MVTVRRGALSDAHFAVRAALRAPRRIFCSVARSPLLRHGVTHPPHDHRGAGCRAPEARKLDAGAVWRHPSSPPMPSTRWVVRDLEGPLDEDSDELCKRICMTFQFDQVHRWQALAMQAVLQGHDVVVASGTGSGKSLVFQGLTLSKRAAIVLVISPLISIMEEQVPPWNLRSR
jgi:DEAD/DEAH box helicase